MCGKEDPELLAGWQTRLRKKMLPHGTANFSGAISRVASHRLRSPCGTARDGGRTDQGHVVTSLLRNNVELGTLRVRVDPGIL